MERATRVKPEGELPDAAALYVGEVMHARLKPLGHRFSYRVMSLLIDLDRLDAADRQSLLFGVNRAAIFGFNEADHGARDGSSFQRAHGRQPTGARRPRRTRAVPGAVAP